jgi:hypothetical protein
MKVARIKTALLLSAAFSGAGCVMSSAPTGPVGLSSKTVSTFAGQAGVMGYADGTGTGAGFDYPAGVAVYNNNLYVCDSANSTIRQISPAGVVTTIAGQPGVAGLVDATGTGPTYFNHPEGIASDGAGNLYIADSGNNVIRRIQLTPPFPSFAVTTIAGNASASPPKFGDGTGLNAYFSNPLGICYDSTNSSLYVADSGNLSVRQVTNITGLANTGIVQTLAGSPTTSTFYWPQGIVFDPKPGNLNLYVVDSGYDEVLQVTTGGVVTALAGSGSAGDVDGTGTSAQFNWPEGITIDSTDTYLYIADTLNSVIRQVTISTGAVITLAGQGQVIGSSDGGGNVATFNRPMRLAVNAAKIYAADTYNETIRMIQ